MPQYIAPLSRDSRPELEDVFKPHEARLGFVPNGFLTLARNSETLIAYHGLTSHVLTGGTVPFGLKLLAAMIVSAISGCVYCQTHLALGMRVAKFPIEKAIDALQHFEEAESLSDAERAVVLFARVAAQQPCAVTSAHMEELARHFSDDQILEFAALVSQFAFLYRVNGMMGTQIEDEPYAYAMEHLSGTGWKPGVHAPGEEEPIPAEAIDMGDLVKDRTQPSGAGMGAADWANRLADVTSPEGDALMDEMAQVVGFQVNSLRIMRRDPPLLKAFMNFALTFRRTNTVPDDLSFMVANVASLAAGCRYCQAHTALNSHKAGVSDEKLAALWSFETSNAFSPAEKAALRFAVAGAIQPQSITRELHQDLQKYFSDREIIDLILAIAIIGFMNRWNEIFATELEDAPKALAERTLSDSGWRPEKHMR